MLRYVSYGCSSSLTPWLPAILGAKLSLSYPPKTVQFLPSSSEAIEKGILELDEKLKIRVQQHKTRREAIGTELATLQRQNQSPMQTITPQKIEAITRVLNKRFATSTPFSRAYLKATVKEISVTDDVLKLTGENKSLANLIASNGIIDPNGEVHRTVPEWRATDDDQWHSSVNHAQGKQQG